MDLEFEFLHPKMTQEDLGFLPQLIQTDDPRPVVDQLADRYSYGGGWNPMQGWTMDPADHSVKYPEDPKLMPVAKAQLGAETIFLYQHAWLAVVQPDGTFEISRVD